jgi:hypothetical protein
MNRDGMIRRPAEVLVRYEIRPVGDLKPALEPVPPNGRELADVVRRDSNGRPVSGPDSKPVTERPCIRRRLRLLGSLTGDVIPLIRDIFERQGPFYLALYELEEILIASAARIHVILANIALGNGNWGTRNVAAVTAMTRENLEIEPIFTPELRGDMSGEQRRVCRVRA